MTRSLATLLTLLAFLAPETRPTIRVPHQALPKLGWQLAIPTASIPTPPGHDLSATIDALHALDIHHLELTPIGDLPIPDILKKLKAVHMDIVSFGPMLVPPDAQRRGIFDAAKALRAKVIVLDGPDPDPAATDRAAADANVALALRGHWPTPADALKSLDGRAPKTGICFDPTTWQHAGIDPTDAIHALAGHITLVRGAGAALAPIIPALKAAGYKGILCVTSPPETGDTGVTDAVNAMSDAVTAAAK